MDTRGPGLRRRPHHAARSPQVLQPGRAVGAAATDAAPARIVRFIVVAVGHRMPAWVDAGFAEYAGRMPRDARVELVALKPAPRGGPLQRVLETEGERVAAAIPAGSYKVVLDERGKLLDTMELARRIAGWQN